jgi:hypothetical protein
VTNLVISVCYAWLGRSPKKGKCNILLQLKIANRLLARLHSEKCNKMLRSFCYTFLKTTCNYSQFGRAKKCGKLPAVLAAGGRDIPWAAKVLYLRFGREAARVLLQLRGAGGTPAAETSFLRNGS